MTFFRYLAALVAFLTFAASAEARDMVPFGGYAPGTVVIVTNARTLYYVTGGG